MATVQRTQPPATSKKNGGKAAPAPATASPAASVPGRDPVAERAYEIWVESGRPQGKDQDHWFQAERELKARSAHH